tara:strand:+ start:87 stop:794 length:708 start_codon:yes stop_codon:yes gene_type:complete
MPFYGDFDASDNFCYYKSEVKPPIWAREGGCERFGKTVKGAYKYPATMYLICKGLGLLRGLEEMQDIASLKLSCAKLDDAGDAEVDSRTSPNASMSGSSSSLKSSSKRSLKRWGSSRSALYKPLWRGIKDTQPSTEFKVHGGTHLGPMSTSESKDVALGYAHKRAQRAATIFKIIPSSQMNKGADIDYLSVYPGEKEYLYPPCTYLSPTGSRETLHYGDVTYKIVELVPIFGEIG